MLTRRTRLALVGPSAKKLQPRLEELGVEIADEPGLPALIEPGVALGDLPRGPLLALGSHDPRARVVARFVDDVPPLLGLLEEARQRDEDLDALVDVTAALAAGGDPETLLGHVVSRIASRLDVERCSLVLIEPGGFGLLVVTSDDAEARGKRIDLRLYPEIREVQRTGAPVVIDDARRHPLLDGVRERIEEHDISAIAVVPVACEGQTEGVLLIRSRTRAGFGNSEIALLSTVASTAAVALRNAGRIQSERSQRVAAERELVALRRYEEFFAHVNDGVAILDAEGRVLVLNPAGSAILGVASDGARGRLLHELVAQESELTAGLLLREVRRGARVLSADLRVLSRDGRSILLSVSAGPMRSESGRAVLTFRDVTEARELEHELRKTKEFLERLIDATSGGIVAADLRGTILLFNKGAERMTGFAAAELVGRAHVDDIYPPGQAREIMKRLRGGEPHTRCEMVARSGEIVPVELSAALVAEGGEETATVGVFRDLREELRAESDLREARDRLAVAEKAALVSELAGAAAHELNQPLTSVLGYAELLLRREPGREELQAIFREAGRMAAIVRKIGNITRYETRAYVGSTRIVDLERASDPSTDAIVIRDKR